MGARTLVLGVLGGAFILSGCAHSGTGKSNGCADPADVTATVAKQTLHLSNCGGVANVPLNAVNLRLGRSVTVDVTHQLQPGPVDLASGDLGVVSIRGLTVTANGAGTTLVTISGLPCEDLSQGTCPLMRVTVN